MFDDENEIEPKDLPIYKKGWEIYEVVDQICQLIPDDNEPLAHVKSIMLEDAMMLTVKVAGAEAGQLYDIKIRQMGLHHRSLGTFQSSRCRSVRSRP